VGGFRQWKNPSAHYPGKFQLTQGFL